MYLILLFTLFPVLSFNSSSSQDLSLYDVSIIDGKGGAVKKHMAIIIEGSKISKICHISEVSKTELENKIDLGGKYIIPGLIEGHAHLRNFPDVQLEYAVRWGMTSIRSMADDASYIKELVRYYDSIGVMIPNIYYSATYAGEEFFKNDSRPGNITPSHLMLGKAPWMRLIDDHINYHDLIMEAKSIGASGIKLYSHLTQSQITNIVIEAHKVGLKVWSHPDLYYTDYLSIANSGVDLITHATLIADGNDRADLINLQLSADDMKKIDQVAPILKSKKVAVEPTLTMLLDRMHKEIDSKNFKSCQKTHIKILQKFWNEGIVCIAGTDMPLPQKEDEMPALFMELNYFVKLIGMSPIEAISTATFESAKVLGIDKEYGSIEVGKTADLIILKRNPAKKIENLTSVFFVMKDGEFVKKLASSL